MDCLYFITSGDKFNTLIIENFKKKMKFEKFTET